MYYKDGPAKIQKYKEAMTALAASLSLNPHYNLSDWVKDQHIYSYASGVAIDTGLVHAEGGAYRWRGGPVTTLMARQFYYLCADFARQRRYERAVEAGKTLTSAESEWLYNFNHQEIPSLVNKTVEPDKPGVDEIPFPDSDWTPLENQDGEPCKHGSTLVLETADGSLFEFTAKGEPRKVPMLHETVTYYLFGLIRVRKRFSYKTVTLPQRQDNGND